MSRQAMEVEPLTEVFDDGEVGNQMGYFAKGHHDPGAFVAACDWYGAENTDEEFLRYHEPMTAAHVRHVYWRAVPIRYQGEAHGFRWVDSGPGRGAVPYTTLEFVRRPRGEADARASTSNTESNDVG